ncbi:MAG: SIS domain-containing protein [Lachnospiraceae bacterium]|nr:SIS domain-containing protein [Lachnospiraceae bacterium]
MVDYLMYIEKYIEDEKKVLDMLDRNEINRALNLLEECLKNDSNIYIFGNGGSSATASHFVNDFNKGISENTKKKFRFQCLNDNIPTVMAIANDIGFDEIFRFQLNERITDKDVIIAISGSGNSKNVINAVEYAKSVGCKIIGLTGFIGGKLKELSDISLHAPINSMQITEDIHMFFDHLMMSIFYKTMCNKEHING